MAIICVNVQVAEKSGKKITKMPAMSHLYLKSYNNTKSMYQYDQI